MAHPHDHDDHSHGRHPASELSPMELRVRALESILVDKGYVDPAALDEIIGVRTEALKALSQNDFDAESMTPIIMKRPDLKSACAIVWSTAAASAKVVPMPIAAVMKPSWLTVEHAMSFLRSVCWRAK